MIIYKVCNECLQSLFFFLSSIFLICYFVALNYDRKKVLGKGYPPEEALKEANKKAYKDIILIK